MIPTRVDGFTGLTAIFVSASGSVLVVVTGDPTKYGFPPNFPGIAAWEFAVEACCEMRWGARRISLSPFSTGSGSKKGRQPHRFRPAKTTSATVESRTFASNERRIATPRRFGKHWSLQTYRQTEDEQDQTCGPKQTTMLA